MRLVRTLKLICEPRALASSIPNSARNGLACACACQIKLKPHETHVYASLIRAHLLRVHLHAVHDGMHSFQIAKQTQAALLHGIRF